MTIEFVLVNDAFPAIFFPHDVDDEAAFLEDAQHIVEGRRVHVAFSETARDDHNVVGLCAKKRMTKKIQSVGVGKE